MVLFSQKKQKGIYTYHTLKMMFFFFLLLDRERFGIGGWVPKMPTNVQQIIPMGILESQSTPTLRREWVPAVFFFLFPGLKPPHPQ